MKTRLTRLLALWFCLVAIQAAASDLARDPEMRPAEPAAAASETIDCNMGQRADATEACRENTPATSETTDESEIIDCFDQENHYRKECR